LRESIQEEFPFVSNEKKNYIKIQLLKILINLLSLGGFRADLLGLHGGMGSLNFLGGSLTERVDQLGKELGDASGRVGSQLEADGTENGVDILAGLDFSLDSTGIQNKSARLEVT